MDECVLPSQLSHYRVLSKLGAGGMGEVWLGEDVILGRRVAIKVLRPELKRDADHHARFLREARAISALSHPNIVTVHEYCSDAGLDFFVTELIAGRTLRQAMNDGNVDPIEIAVAVANALAAAHAASIVHRDVKPENIIVGDSGPVKLVDFGLAKSLAPSPATSELVTGAGSLIGTAAYMAPEQVRCQDVDARADVFSLGVVLYEMLAGRRPFGGLSSQDVLAAILRSEPEPLPRVVDATVAALVMRMLDKRAGARPSASEVAALLASHKTSGRAGTAVTMAWAAEKPTEQFAKPASLPAETTPLIGRDVDVRRIAELLARDDVRLVTITATGGSGKTRVAIRVASELVPEFRGGVVFVPLESVNDPSLLLPAIAQAAAVAENAGESLDSALAQAWNHRAVLLVLDNFEQLVEAAPAVAALLARNPTLKCLVTSQTALQIRGDHEYPLDPLDVESAAALFVERAKAVRRDFELTPENRASVKEICRLLDGIPLAIELAAARVKVFSPAAIVERLSDPLQLLTGGPRDLPPRQRALRSALAWSYQLLDEAEQTAFARLGVFHGGWSLDAAEQVCMLDDAALGGLADKSLVRRAGSDDDPRWTMLEPVRLLAVEKLRESGEADALAQRHLDWFVEFAEAASGTMTGAGSARSFDAIARDEKNLRATLDFALQHARVETGLRIASSIWRYWHSRGGFSVGRRYLSALLDAGEASDPVRSAGLFAAGVLADAQGDHDEARARFEQQLTLARSRNDSWAVANALNNLAITAFRAGDFETAALSHEEALATWVEFSNIPAAALSLQNLGNVDRARGLPARARERYRSSVEMFQSIGDRRGVAMSLTYLADVDREEGAFPSALLLYEESLRIFIELNDHCNVASCMAEYGETARLAGDRAQAHELLEESVLILRELGNRRAAAQVLDSIAMLAADEGQHARTLRLAAAASAIRRELRVADTPNPARDSAVGNARSHLGSSAEREWQIGSQMTFAEAVDAAQSGAV